MNTKNNEQEREAFMGFKLSQSIQEEVIKLVSASDWDQEEAKLIPDADGMVLVKEGSKAFEDRRHDQGIFMIPVKMKGMSSGQEVEMIFFVCTK